jgi:glycerol uptake facilitator-like aquaporin
MRTVFRDNGLSITLLALFALTVAGQAFFGLSADNQERIGHGLPAVTLVQYLSGGQFLSSLFENWESEFLQMLAFVMLTVFLFQRGSPESKDPDAEAPQDRDPALDANKADAPWPVRAGAVARWLYSHSLGLTLLALFLASFFLHAHYSTLHAKENAVAHGEAPPDFLDHIVTAQFWFESFQNWQSEFLSTAALVVLAIFLRERGSAESKPVAAPHGKTGTD